MPDDLPGAERPRVTVVIVPRERFAAAEASLESLLATTAPAFDVVYVDAGCPPRLRRRLQALERRSGFRRLRAPGYLLPNAARNLALREVTTELVVLADNDVRFEPGWLDALVRCADETGADLVCPLYLMGDAADPRVHGAASVNEVEEEAGRRRWAYAHPHKGERLATVPPFERGPCSLVEFHCFLAQRSALEAVGPLDEGLRVLEHNDLSLAVRRRGGEIAFEPRARVTWLDPRRVAPSELPYFLVRWSERDVRASVQRFGAKWGLPPDDPGLVNYPRLNTRHRARFLLPLRNGLAALCGPRLARHVEERWLLPAEVRLNRLAVPWLERRAWRSRA